MEDLNPPESDSCGTSDGLEALLQALSPRHRTFVVEYTGIHGLERGRWSATDAAKRAGYSAKTAGQIGWELLQREDVKAAISGIIEDRRSRYANLIERCIDELEKVAFSELHDVVQADGISVVVKSIDDIPVAARAAISEIRENINPKGDSSITVKLHNKTNAIGLLLKTTGGIVERYAGPDGKSGIPVDHNHGLTKAGRDKLLEALGLPVKGDGDNGESK